MDGYQTQKQHMSNEVKQNSQQIPHLSVNQNTFTELNQYQQNNKQNINKPTFINKQIICVLIIFLMILIITIIFGIQYIIRISNWAQQRNKLSQSQINRQISNQQTFKHQIIKQLQLNENKLANHLDQSFKINSYKVQQNLKTKYQQFYTSKVAEYEMIKFKFSQASNVSVVFTTCCNRQIFLQQTLRTFAQYNTYPLRKVIIVNDGQMTLSLINILKKVQNVILLNTLKKVGQIVSIDEAYKIVDTPYVFHCEDDWATIRSGVIEEDIQVLEKDPKILMVWNQQHWVDQPKGQKVQWDSQWNGFSFNPTIIRMQIYKKLQGGYKQLTKNTSYGKGAGRAQLDISKYYREQGYYIWTAKQNYFRHIGADNVSPKYW